MRLRHVVVATLATAGVIPGVVGATVMQPGGAAVGPRANGTAVLPTGWEVTPAGRQVSIGEKPFGAALSPDGKTLLVSNDGQYLDSLQVIDVASNKVLETIQYNNPDALFVGVAWSPDGKHAYASAGDNDKVRTYDVAGQHLTETGAITIPSTKAMPNPFPAGLAVSADGSQLYVADEGGAAMSVVNLGSGAVTATIPVGSNPYTVEVNPSTGAAYVSNWGGNTVSVVDPTRASVTKTVEVGNHPSAMTLSPDHNKLFVANTDADTVSVIDTASNVVTREIDLSPYAHAPIGSSPDALTLSPDGETLYVANAGDDDVAVVHLAENGRRDEVAGLIPTAWYPTTVTTVDGGSRLFVTNGKGLGAGPNPGGPNPYTWDNEFTPTFESQYSGGMIMGTLSVIATPDADQLARFTAQVRHNDAFDRVGQNEIDRAGSAILPRRAGESSPIKHVIYVLKENRTYDQVLGDLGQGNGDPRLTLFGWPITPNQHRLAKQFVTLDNFYTNGEVSQDGWQWDSGAYANAHNERTWPPNYGNRYSGNTNDATYVDSPGRNPERSYLWDEAIAAHRSMRDYGWWVSGSPRGTVVADPTAPELAPYANPNFPEFAIDTVRDRDNEQVWQREFDHYEATSSLPSFETVLLPADHTVYTTPGSFTPKAMVADNDYALGKLVDAVSHSKDWKDTAILVVEDDSQDGADHVDAHRTVAQFISPYTQTGRVDSTLYSQVSMLRTIESILGLPPMTQFDASALPMLGAVTNRPNFAPYNAVVPQQNMDERNTSASPMAAMARKWNVRRPDQVPAILGEEAIWKSVHGAHSHMPRSPKK